jgi:DNA-binding MltR family transcriptional regulator
MGKKKYFSVSELADDMEVVYNKLFNSDDIICVLLGANFIDRCLANALVITLPIKDKDFIKNELLDYNNGVLATYSSRNRILYALKKIDKNFYNDISLIGKIRNRFAHHHLEISFNDDEVKMFCNKLTLWENRYTPKQIKSYKELPQSEDSIICKTKFVESTTEIINKFIALGLIHKIIYESDI